MKLTDKQIEILKKYEINYEKLNQKELLIEIDDVMTTYLDKNYNTTPEYMELERLYDSIYDIETKKEA